MDRLKINMPSRRLERGHSQDEGRSSGIKTRKH